MGKVCFTGNDTIKFNGDIFTGFVSGDVLTIAFPNDIVNVKRGKDGVAIYSFNEMGKVVDVTLKVLRGCDDDKKILTALSLMKSNFNNFSLLSIDVTRMLGPSAGADNYMLTGGVFTKSNPEFKTNVEGDVEQGVAIYMMKFTAESRSIS
jgi:hypothetical protein